MKKEFTKGIEVVASPLIVNRKGEILLVKSRKWGDNYVIPGGHIEPGEGIFKCAEREGKEETGLKLKSLYCINIGELLNDPNFNRKAHLLYFHILCEALTEDVQLDGDELQKHIWIKPEEALKKLKILHGIDDTIKNYINGVKVKIQSDAF